jgi:hypothetical protein
MEFPNYRGTQVVRYHRRMKYIYATEQDDFSWRYVSFFIGVFQVRYTIQNSGFGDFLNLSLMLCDTSIWQGWNKYRCFPPTEQNRSFNFYASNNLLQLRLEEYLNLHISSWYPISRISFLPSYACFDQFKYSEIRNNSF